MDDRPTNLKSTAGVTEANESAGFGTFVRDTLGNMQRWAARSFTVENFIATLKTLAWVTPLTVLIWVYAEREQVVPRRATIPLGVKSPDPSRLVRLRPGDESVSAELVGPNAAIERVQELVRLRGEDLMPAVQIEIDRTIPADGAWHQINTTQAIASNPIFRSRGVTVRDCTPQTLMVLVDELEERDVEVRAPASVTNLAGKPQFVPRTVRLRGPKAALQKLGADIFVEADFSGRAQLRTPGTHDMAAIPLTPPVDDPSVSMVPSTVRATVEVNQSDVRYLVESIPVYNLVPPGKPSLLEKFWVDRVDILTNIHVVGPADKIDLLKKQPPKARLELSREDENKSQQTRKVSIDLPEGVHVAKEDEAKCVVAFQLKPLTASE